MALLHWAVLYSTELLVGPAALILLRGNILISGIFAVSLFIFFVANENNFIFQTQNLRLLKVR